MGISKRGFASMDSDKVRSIASKGGISAHARGNAHEFTSDEARAAGIKSGIAKKRNLKRYAESGLKAGVN